MAVTLTWVRDNYDKNKNRYIDSSEQGTADDDFHHEGTISEEELIAVSEAYSKHTLLPTYAASTVKAAKGKIVNFNYPTTAKTNERVAIRAAVQNSGNASGLFKLQLYKSYTRVAQSTLFTVASGQTSATKSLYVTTPGGGSISYELRCVRTT